MPVLEFKDLLIVILVGIVLAQFLLTRKMVDPTDLIVFIELLKEQAKKTESTLDDRLLEVAEDILTVQDNKDKTTTVTLTQVTDTSKTQMNG